MIKIIDIGDIDFCNKCPLMERVEGKFAYYYQCFLYPEFKHTTWEYKESIPVPKKCNENNINENEIGSKIDRILC